ncbi:MAG: PhoPQ-activated pathogenicity-related family protein [Armatimonadaceae bacterium]
MNRRDFLRVSSGAMLAGVPVNGLSELNGLTGYLERPESVYRWEKREARSLPTGTVQDLYLVSQTWHGETWDHRLQVFFPQTITRPDTCLLYNTGGNGNRAEEQAGLAFANLTGSPVAFLFGIPKQPLYGGLKEDALIVETWKRFLESGDETWLLQFPMVKSVVKAMDAVQEFTVKEKRPEIVRFVITGASKRGWTAWLTGASGDKRVMGIAPMVIDMLNLRAQTRHQREVYGTYSEQVSDYTRAGMQEILLSPRGDRLLQLVDPYNYRDRLTLPKLIINGTNDRYWTQDGLNLYWDGLRGEKRILYVPNSGHALEDRGRVLQTLTAFTRSLADQKPLPALTWNYDHRKSETVLTVESARSPENVLLWRVNAPTQDFREAKWVSTPVMWKGKGGSVTIPAPVGGYSAVFAEARFVESDGKPFTLSTQIAILKSNQEKV